MYCLLFYNFLLIRLLTLCTVIIRSKSKNFMNLVSLFIFIMRYIKNSNTLLQILLLSCLYIKDSIGSGPRVVPGISAYDSAGLDLVTWLVQKCSERKIGLIESMKALVKY